MPSRLNNKSKVAFGFTTRLSVLTFAALVGFSIITSTTNAGLDAIAFNTTPQVINSGTVSITLTNGDGGSLTKGFSHTFDKMLPGDTNIVYVKVTNADTAIKDLELSLSESPTVNTRLTRDATQGLKVSVTSCPTAWAAGVCVSPTTRLTNVALSTINTSTTGAATPLVSGAIAASAVQYLKFEIALPDITEVTTNGIVPANSIQGLSTNVLWKFKAVQRAGTPSSN
jgi:hypothetical protein